jgi:hypothetical protein
MRFLLSGWHADGADRPAGSNGPCRTTHCHHHRSGVNPVEVVVAVGGRVLFVNNDVIPHDIAGGPEPARPDCPEIDAVGFLTPG